MGRAHEGRFDEAEVTIHDLASDGAGVGHLPDGRVVFVHRTAPGDRVRIQLHKARKRWARGRLLQLLEAGPDRRSAPCPRYEHCGGCVLEHLEYPAQLEAKARRVRETLERVGGLQELPGSEIHPSPREFRYRNRATFVLRRLAGGRVVAGFHALGRPGRIVDLGGECLLLEEGVARAWEGIRASWGPGAERLPRGPALHLMVRGLADGTALLLVEGGKGRGEPEELLRGVEGLRAVWWAPERGPGPVKGSGSEGGSEAKGIRGEMRLLAGESEVEEIWFGESIRIGPDAFLQVNREAAGLLHDLVLREAAPPGELRILDAYCGFGVYGRRLARAGARTVGIESSPRAAAMAGERPVPGFQLLEGRVEDRLGEALPVDRAILNPPRGGVGEGVMEAMAEGVGDRIIYVSCDPATLARDLARLGEGFQVARIQVLDLFPQTAHVETVVTLTRNPPGFDG